MGTQAKLFALVLQHSASVAGRLERIANGAGGAEYPLFRRDAHVRVRRFRSGTPSRQSDVDEPIHAAMPPLVPRAFSAVSCRSHSLRNFDDRRVWRDSAADSLNGL